ncbi:copper resistance CopC family protein [Occultella gossypii]|uniref:Copper resistance protein CopC n=1 Tax=Occultella gossypii TaxID=2800820 RepID=A0ABS7SFJ8_9MICO|nr:copper resistance CopC family protein [Occultella gossypii]MBZ2198673.1 copper resistance protein CopC [Occultella gossypii]
MSPSPRALNLRTLAISAVALFLGLTIHASAAQAHDVLLSSAPAEGETLSAAPTEIRLTFNNEILDLSAAIVLTDAEGTVLTEEPPVVDGAEVALPLPDGVPAGVWTVTWRVVSSDGHPISGTYEFTVDAPVVTTVDPTEPAEPTEPTEADTTDAGTSEPEPSDSASAVDAGDDGSGPGAGSIVAFVVVAIAVVGAVVAVIVRRSRS